MTRRAGRDPGRSHRPRPRRRCVARRGHRFPGADARHRGDRPGAADCRGAGRRHAAGAAGSGRTARPELSARSRRARHRDPRRQCRDQCRRQSRDPLRHDARHGARSRGRAGRRHHPVLDEPPDQEQRGLRPQADLHRLRRHARDHHAAGTAAAREAELAGRRDRGGAVVRGADETAQAHRQRARRIALGLRGDVAVLLPPGDVAAGAGQAAGRPGPSVLRPDRKPRRRCQTGFRALRHRAGNRAGGKTDFGCGDSEVGQRPPRLLGAARRRHAGRGRRHARRVRHFAALGRDGAICRGIERAI